MSTAARSTITGECARGEPMKTYSVVMRTRGPKEYTDGERHGARQRFLRYLKIRTARILQEIVDGDLRASNGHASPPPDRLRRR